MTYWESGTYNCLCQECGFTYKRNQLRRRYDGMLVCSKDWEPDPEPRVKIRQIRNKKIDGTDKTEDYTLIEGGGD